MQTLPNIKVIGGAPLIMDITLFRADNAVSIEDSNCEFIEKLLVADPSKRLELDILYANTPMFCSRYNSEVGTGEISAGNLQALIRRVRGGESSSQARVEKKVLANHDIPYIIAELVSRWGQPEKYSYTAFAVSFEERSNPAPKVYLSFLTFHHAP